MPQRFCLFGDSYLTPLRGPEKASYCDGRLRCNLRRLRWALRRSVCCVVVQQSARRSFLAIPFAAGCGARAAVAACPGGAGLWFPVRCAAAVRLVFGVTAAACWAVGAAGNLVSWSAWPRRSMW